MLNSREFYEGLGRQAAQARNLGDKALASFHASHFRRARGLEKDADRSVVSQWYTSAYLEHRKV